MPQRGRWGWQGLISPQSGRRELGQPMTTEVQGPQWGLGLRGHRVGARSFLQLPQQRGIGPDRERRCRQLRQHRQWQRVPKRTGSEQLGGAHMVNEG